MLKNNVTVAACFLFLFLIAYVVYSPGLDGGFLFDDYGNLPALGAYGPVNNSQTLLRYLTSGEADPTGRPVSLASFLIDARNWPADPFPFKRTNIFLHLVNGLLLMLLLLRIGRERMTMQHAAWAALVGTGFWLLHPLFVSTTLYIIQRQAMLAAAFVLLGLLGYLHGRQKIIDGNAGIGCLYAAGSILICTILATLSKANGVLLPILAVVLEFTVLIRAGDKIAMRQFRHMRFIILGVPCLALFYVMLVRLQVDLSQHPPGRPWSYAERFLTQPRVLLDYLRLLWLPSPFTSGLFNDQIQHSSNWLKPLATLPALGAICGLIVIGIIGKRRFPILSGALLFYFAGHLLESTIIPLELYYEHRNYLPATLLFWPLAVWLTQKDEYLHAKIILTLVLIVGLAAMTYSRSTLWGNTEEQAMFWAEINPDSPRAQAYAAQIELGRNQIPAAAQRLNTAIERFRDQPQIGINLLVAKCKRGEVEEKDIAAAEHSLEVALEGSTLLYKWMRQAIGLATSGECTGFDLHTLSRLVDAAGRNPNIMQHRGRRQDLMHIKGLISLAHGDADKASRVFKKSVRAYPRAKVGLTMAASLAQAGHFCHALMLLDDLEQLEYAEKSTGLNMKSLHAWMLDRQGYWPEEIRILRTTILGDIEKLGQCPPECSRLAIRGRVCRTQNQAP